MRARARNYFLAGADSDDVEQEALIGLFKAVRDFRPDREATFGAFADVCITRQLVSAVKAATRRKHEPLNYSLPETAARTEQLEDSGADPATQVVQRAEVAALARVIDEHLSRFETQVIRLHAEGRSYQEIGARVGRGPKAVDNALQRAKRKLERQPSMS